MTAKVSVTVVAVDSYPVTVHVCVCVCVCVCAPAVVRVDKDGWVQSHELFARLGTVGLGPVLKCIKPESGTPGYTRARFNFENLYNFVKAPLPPLEDEPGEKRSRKKRGLLLPPKSAPALFPC